MPTSDGVQMNEQLFAKALGLTEEKKESSQ